MYLQALALYKITYPTKMKLEQKYEFEVLKYVSANHILACAQECLIRKLLPFFFFQVRISLISQLTINLSKYLI